MDLSFNCCVFPEETMVVESLTDLLKYPHAALLLLRLPSGEILFWMIHFAAFTATSALPLNWGKATDNSLCLTLYSLRKSWKLFDMNCGPPTWAEFLRDSKRHKQVPKDIL